MCSIALALPALTGIVGFIGQSQAANAQEGQIVRGQHLQNEAFAAQRTDITDAAETEISDRVRQAKIEKGRLRVAQGESGLAGVTFARLQRDVDFQSGTDISRIQTSTRKRIEQSKREQGASDHRSRSNALQINRPSLIGTGLQIAGGTNKAITAEKQNRK